VARTHAQTSPRLSHVKSDLPLSSIVFAHRLFRAGTAWGSLCLVFRVISRSRETLTTARRENVRRHFYRAINVGAIVSASRRGEERTNARHKNSSLVRKTLRSWIVTARVNKYSEWVAECRNATTTAPDLYRWSRLLKINDVYGHIRLSSGILSIMEPRPFPRSSLHEKKHYFHKNINAKYPICMRK